MAERVVMREKTSRAIFVRSFWECVAYHLPSRTLPTLERRIRKRKPMGRGEQETGREMSWGVLRRRRESHEATTSMYVYIYSRLKPRARQRLLCWTHDVVYVVMNDVVGISGQILAPRWGFLQEQRDKRRTKCVGPYFLHI